MIQGINHITFSVSNLDVSIDFYRRVFGAEPLLRGDEMAYLDVAGIWLALNVQESIPRSEIRQSYTHIAFTVDAADIPAIEQRLEQLGVALLPGRSRGDGEGHSLYFADPDGHLLEVHTGSLEARLQAYQCHENFSSAKE